MIEVFYDGEYPVSCMGTLTIKQSVNNNLLKFIQGYVDQPIKKEANSCQGCGAIKKSNKCEYCGGCV